MQIGIVGISAGPANAADTVAAMIEDRNYKKRYEGTGLEGEVFVTDVLREGTGLEGEVL